MAKRNTYRNLVIEYYARNSSSVKAITGRCWPAEEPHSQPHLAQLLSEKAGWEVDYRSLSRQLRRIGPGDVLVRKRIQELIYDPQLYLTDHGNG